MKNNVFTPTGFINEYINFALDRGPTKLFPYQEKLIDFLDDDKTNRYSFITHKRRVGMTVFLASYVIFESIRKPQNNIKILFGCKYEFDSFHRIFREMIENLPQFDKSTISKSNDCIKFGRSDSTIYWNRKGVNDIGTISCSLRGCQLNKIFVLNIEEFKQEVLEEMLYIAAPGCDQINLLSTEEDQRFRLSDNFNQFNIDYRDVPFFDDEWYEKRVKEMGCANFIREYVIVF